MRKKKKRRPYMGDSNKDEGIYEDSTKRVKRTKKKRKGNEIGKEDIYPQGSATRKGKDA
jgi:hypothetical protein